MRSQVRFFMDSADERAFLEEVTRDPAMALVDGPDWETREPPLLSAARLPSRAGYILIWNRADVPRLRTRREGGRLEVVNEHETIQFLRCRVWDKAVLTEGRIAIASEDGHSVARHYNALRKWIRGTFRNRLVCWTDAERTVRSAPDATVWIGPGALQWLSGDDNRRLKQDRESRTEAILCDSDAP